MATADSPQALLCKFVEVFLWAVASKNLWSLQNLSLTFPDSIRKNFDYHKLRQGEYSCVSECSATTSFLIIFACPYYCIEKMCFYWKLKNACFQNMFLTLKLFRKMISTSNQNTEYKDFSFGKHLNKIASFRNGPNFSVDLLNFTVLL